MKVAVLVCMTPKGAFLVEASAKGDEMLDLAKKVRTSGAMDGQKVVAGLVFHSERLNPIKKFRCVDPEAVSAKAQADKDAAKAKAQADKDAAKANTK